MASPDNEVRGFALQTSDGSTMLAGEHVIFTADRRPAVTLLVSPEVPDELVISLHSHCGAFAKPDNDPRKVFKPGEQGTVKSAGADIYVWGNPNIVRISHLPSPKLT